MIFCVIGMNDVLMHSALVCLPNVVFESAVVKKLRWLHCHCCCHYLSLSVNAHLCCNFIVSVISAVCFACSSGVLPTVTMDSM